jgi:uncharacterized protein YggE
MLLVTTSANASEDNAEKGRIIVNGTATTYVTPDILNWDISIHETNKNLKVAKSKTDERLKALLAIAQKYSEKPEDLQTSGPFIQKKYKPNILSSGMQESVFEGYEVTWTIRLTMHQIKPAETFYDEIVGNNDLDVSCGYDSSNILEIRKKTRIEAVKNAKEKAQYMIEAAGGKIGQVAKLEETNEVPIYCGGGLISNSAENFDQNSDNIRNPDSAQERFVPGKMEVKISISAEFEIE